MVHRLLPVLTVLLATYLPVHAQLHDPDEIVLTVIDIGQGDAILIEFPANADGSRRTMLIDGGVSSSTSNAVVGLLEDKGITTLDVVVLTHPHFDHYAGLIPVFNRFIIDEFWWSGERRGPRRETDTPSTWTEFETAMARANERVLLEQGDKRYFQGARIEVLNAGREYPDTDAGVDINNDSVVLMLYYSSVKMLFTGDIEEDEGQDLVNDYCSNSVNGSTSATMGGFDRSKPKNWKICSPRWRPARRPSPNAPPPAVRPW